MTVCDQDCVISTAAWRRRATAAMYSAVVASVAKPVWRASSFTYVLCKADVLPSEERESGPLEETSAKR